MIVHVELHGKLPKAWFEYVDQNPELAMVSNKSTAVRLLSATPEEQLPGLITALGRLDVPVSAVRVGSPRKMKGSVEVRKTG